MIVKRFGCTAMHNTALYKCRNSFKQYVCVLCLSMCVCMCVCKYVCMCVVFEYVCVNMCVCVCVWGMFLGPPLSFVDFS